MDNIKKAAKKFIRELKGDISFDAVKRYLIFNGYEVIFYNSDEIGDELLKKYGLYDYALTKMAFTLRKNNRKIVFINDCNQNKLCSIIHEAAHKVFNHMYADEHTANERLQELEAESFTHYVINYRKPKFPLLSIICIVLAASSLFMAIKISKENAIPDNLVYVTKTGKKFHRESCMYVVGKDCATLTIKEAQKGYDPCKVCNPLK